MAIPKPLLQPGKRTVHLPSAEEDAHITAAALSDPDAQLKAMRPYTLRIRRKTGGKPV